MCVRGRIFWFLVSIKSMCDFGTASKECERRWRAKWSRAILWKPLSFMYGQRKDERLVGYTSRVWILAYFTSTTKQQQKKVFPLFLLRFTHAHAHEYTTHIYLDEWLRFGSMTTRTLNRIARRYNKFQCGPFMTISKLKCEWTIFWTL